MLKQNTKTQNSVWSQVFGAAVSLTVMLTMAVKDVDVFHMCQKLSVGCSMHHQLPAAFLPNTQYMSNIFSVTTRPLNCLALKVTTL